MSLVFIVIALMISIVFHEYGHMKTAKLFGVKVYQFCIGMGKMIWKKKGKDGVEYGIAPLPFGGYCSLSKEELEKKPFYQYAIVTLAGIFNNMLLGLFFTFVGSALVLLGKGLAPSFDLLGKCLTITATSFAEMFSQFGEIFAKFFNIKRVVADGGAVTQFSNLGDLTLSLGVNGVQRIGFCVLVAGLVNYSLMVINLIPLPALDGGQVLIEGICRICTKIFKKDVVVKRVANLVTLLGFLFIFGYQIIMFLCDIPFIRDLVLNF